MGNETFNISLCFAVAALLLIGVTNASHAPLEPNSSIKGRLLTPQEGCGISTVKKPKIVGGSISKPGAWPWIAAIGYYMYKGYEFECGGALITSRHILTAAHCVDKVGFVRLGAHNIEAKDGSYQDVKVVHAIEHPDYDRSPRTADIGILYLEHDVEFTDRIRPICLPVEEPIRSQNLLGTNPFLAGWGATENGTNSAILKEIQMPLHENELCRQLHKKVLGFDRNEFTKSVICAGILNGGEGSCNGDSGGPLMLPIQQNGMFPFYQIGVVAFGLECAAKDSPGGYTSTQYYADWIQEMIKKEF